MIEFEEEFASLSDYARMYRQLGLQAVPSYYPSRKIPNWKRPALSEWREHQNELATDEEFSRWFNNIDEKKNNIGLLTGACSGGLFVVDLDTHKKPESALWWSNCLDLQDRAGDLESPTQRTGGGGLQILFKAPTGWSPPTIKTSLGVDIRGVGGFIVCAPSMHESGTRYAWVEGQEPWNMEIATAPMFLCEQIDILAREYGGHVARDPSVKTSTPDHYQDAWGTLVDGREDYMFRMVWARLVDIARECPIKPGDGELEKSFDDLFAIYLRKVDTRLPHGSDYDKADLLEREGRGRTEFSLKWKAALREWDKVLEHARKPKPGGEKGRSALDAMIAEGFASNVAAGSAEEEEDWDAPAPEGKLRVENPVPANMFEVLSVDDIYNMPDPVFLIDNMVIENGMMFIYGSPGCGKTFLAMDMAFSLCCEEVTHWMGKKINRHGPVVYISAEGWTDAKFRMQAWEKEKKLPINRKNFHFIREPMNFMDQSDVMKLIQTIKYRIENMIGEKPVAVFIDTVSRVIPGADENAQKDTTLFIQACDAIRITFGPMVGGVHHTPKGQDTLRGSGTLEGSANTSIYVHRDKPSMIATMALKKFKEGRDSWEEQFLLKEVPLGFANSSLVAVTLPAPASVAKGEDRAQEAFGGRQETVRKPDMETCRRMVDAINEAYVAGCAWTSKKGNRLNDRYAAQKLADAFGYDLAVCESYVSMWLKNDVIINDSPDGKEKSLGLRRARGL